MNHSPFSRHSTELSRFKKANVWKLSKTHFRNIQFATTTFLLNSNFCQSSFIMISSPNCVFISKELLEEFSGGQVVSYYVEEGSKPGDNFLSVIYSVSAVVEPRNEESSSNSSSTSREERHYLFKCYPQHPARQPYLNKTNMFQNELSFYTVWVKALIKFQIDIGLSKDQIIYPPFPECLGGKTIDFSKLPKDAQSKVYQPLDNFIVMMDLKKTWNYQMLPKTIVLEFDHVSLVFNELAKIHALSWAYRKSVEWDLQKSFPFLQSPLESDDLSMWGNIVKGNCDIAIQTLEKSPGREFLCASVKQFAEKLDKIIKLFIYQTEEAERNAWNLHRDAPKDMVQCTQNENFWRVIIHGDTWNNNLLWVLGHDLKPERVKILDFQLTREACPTADMVYLIYTGTTKEFRLTHLPTLFQIYVDKFNEVSSVLNVEPFPEFSVSTLARKFHRNKILGFLNAMVILPIILKEEGRNVDLELADGNAEMEGLFKEAFGTGVSSLYEERLTELSQELYNEGVI